MPTISGTPSRAMISLVKVGAQPVSVPSGSTPLKGGWLASPTLTFLAALRRASNPCPGPAACAQTLPGEAAKALIEAMEQASHLRVVDLDDLAQEFKVVAQLL